MRQYIKDMRQRLGIEEDDDSRDGYIEGLSPMERLKLICGWNLGHPGHAAHILDWVKDAGYTVKVD